MPRTRWATMSSTWVAILAQAEEGAKRHNHASQSRSLISSCRGLVIKHESRAQRGARMCIHEPIVDTDLTSSVIDARDCGDISKFLGAQALDLGQRNLSLLHPA